LKRHFPPLRKCKSTPLSLLAAIIHHGHFLCGLVRFVACMTLLRNRSARPWAEGRALACFEVCGFGFEVCGARVRQAHPGGARASKSRRRRPCCGQDAGSVTMIRVFFSTMVAASLARCRRSVSNWARRHGDFFGQAARNFHQIQYPGIGGNPNVEIVAKISGADALHKSSSVRYRFDKDEEEFLPESYLGLGYQNLIYLTFRLLEFRDKWMRVGKSASSGENVEEQIEPIHLVLLEEPEVNLHAQVQRVFASKAYDTLRNHSDLRDQNTAQDKPEYQTQLVISTHSSHIIDDIDFKDLRYFRRNSANAIVAMDHTSIANMSELFVNAKEELKFVRKHLKLTHCDIFFADGVIFVEGQAERLLVPEFISKSFSGLSNRYISMLEVSGAHTHKYKDLVEKLGVATLVLTDLDSVDSEGASCFPEIGANQKSNNDTLRIWHPKKEALDDLIALPKTEHATTSQGAPLYIAYQKPVNPNNS
jgi:hypothetical protein